VREKNNRDIGRSIFITLRGGGGRELGSGEYSMVVERPPRPKCGGGRSTTLLHRDLFLAGRVKGVKIRRSRGTWPHSSLGSAGKNPPVHLESPLEPKGGARIQGYGLDLGSLNLRQGIRNGA